MTGKTRDGSRMPALHSAVRRLRDVKAHQQSLAKEFRHNWRGWLGSVVFHASLLLIFMSVTWSILTEEREYTITVSQIKKHDDVSTEPLENLLKKSIFQSEMQRPSSANVDVTKPIPGSFRKFDDPGVPEWVGRGPFRPGDPGEGGEPGGGGGGGTRFKKHVEGIKALDIVFVFDSTGSMGGVIREVKTRIRTFMSAITYLVPKTRLGLVTYRDLKKFDIDEFEYTVRFTPLTKGTPKGIAKLQRFLRSVDAFGGGDIPEAVYDGVETAIRRARWRQGSKRVIIVVGDAPPRPENNGLAKLYDLAKSWHDRTGGIICCIDTTGGSRILEEFKEMAASGGGRADFLNSERDIVKRLMMSVFPKEYEGPVAAFWKRIADEAHQDVIIEEK